MVTIFYFAWLRQKMGKNSEQIELPDDVTTSTELMRFLAARTENDAEAFADETLVKIAVNQTHIEDEVPLSDGDEIAFFPAVTGG